MKQRKVHNLVNFTMGYTDKLPNEEIPDNMLAQAENIYSKAGLLRKRGGMSEWGDSEAPLDTATDVIRGSIRAYINSTWYTIMAEDDGTNVSFWYHTSGTGAWTEITGKTFAAEYDVEFAVLNGFVVAVNGQDKPLVIYYADSAWNINTLEAYDERTRGIDDWYAGQYDASGTPWYIDDTTNAQDTTADNFQLASTTDNDGFYVAGFLTFNKVVFKSAQQMAGSPAAEYRYYKDDGDGTYSWGTPANAAMDVEWDASDDTDKTLTFDIPTDWALMDTTDADSNAVIDSMVNKYVLRVRFTTAPTVAKSCDTLTVHHTQYLTQITGGDAIQGVAVHENRMFLSSFNTVNISPYNKVTDWNEFDVEYFSEGGDRISKMVTHREYLAIVKEKAIYGLFGNSWENWTINNLYQNGSKWGRTVVVAGDYLFFKASDGVYTWDGKQGGRISKHVAMPGDPGETAIQAMGASTSAGAAAIEYGGDYLLALSTSTPTSFLYRIDPDTIRSSPDKSELMGAFFKYTAPTGFVFGHMMVHKGAGDDDKLVCISNLSTSLSCKFMQIENGNAYDLASTSQTNIDCKFKTKHYTFGMFQEDKNYGRVKLDVEKAGDWTFTLYAENEDRSSSRVVSSGTGGGHNLSEHAVPYQLDGVNLAFYLRNDTTYDFKIYGIAIDVGGRGY